MAVKVLGLMEVYQVLVVNKDLYREGGSMEVVSPGLQSADDCEEFAIVHAVIILSRNKQLGEVWAEVLVAFGVGLEKDYVRSILGSIGGNGK